MTNNIATEPVPTTGIWAEEPEYYLGRRLWVSECIQADGTVLYQGVVDGEIVPELYRSSGLAQRAAVARIEELDSELASAPVRRTRVQGPTRMCGYCGARVGAQELCCGDHG